MQPTLTPKQTETLSAHQYIQRMRNKHQKSNIKHIRFVPPKIGADGYGHFEITYKMPILVTEQ